MVGEMRLKTIEGALIGFAIALAPRLAVTILSSSHPIRSAEPETRTGPAQPFQTASTIDPEAPLPAVCLDPLSWDGDFSRTPEMCISALRQQAARYAEANGQYEDNGTPDLIEVSAAP
jgi:hypothetical protein